MTARSALGSGAALAALIASGCFAGGCGAGSPAIVGPNGAPGGSGRAGGGSFVLTDRDIDAVIRDTTSARQMEMKHPIAVQRLDVRRFRERLLGPRDEVVSGDDGTLSQDSAFLLGFDFVPQPGKRGGIATVDEVLEEQVVGYYDLAADRVFIPDIGLKTEDDLQQQRAVLAHEVQHALQAQVFPKAPKAESQDQALAQLALVEGDAQVAMGAWLGAQAGAPVGRTLRRIVEVTKRVPLSNVSRGEETKKLDKALALVKRRLEFPYVDGMMFVSDVYRAGGFPLVDKVYASPPKSTAHILHPEKYLRGDLPRAVADPRPPAGFTRTTAGTLGELDTRVLLERCLDGATAERAAAGWTGDRYAVLVGQGRRLATVWVSAWETDQDAAEMEDALTKSAACWHDNALGLAASDFTIGADVHVKRRGKLVAFERGLPQGTEEAAFASLFPLVGPEQHGKPLTDLKIPPRVRLPEPVPGRLAGDVYQNDWLGVVGRVPSGMIARTSSDMDLMVERPDVLVRGGVSISTRITSDEQNERTFREVQEAFVANVAKLSMQVQALGGGPLKTALGAGVERSWRVAGTAVELRTVLIPICAGTGAIVFIQAYGDAYARSVLDGWIESFRWIHGRNITACDFLDPK